MRITSILTVLLAIADACFAGPILNDSVVYYVFTSDHEAPTRREGVREFEYEAVYVISAEKLIKGEELRASSTRISKIGKQRDAVWNKQGDKIAYLDLSQGWGKNRMVVFDANSGKGTVLKDVHPESRGISWNERGTCLAYRDTGYVCVYDIVRGKEERLCKAEGEGISFSPSGEMVCFKTRDGTGVNDTDGWRLNIFHLKTSKTTKVGKTNDNFGVITPFYWSHDSSFIVFTRFSLDNDQKHKSGSYRYNIVPGTLETYTGDFSDVYIQNIRYWTKPKTCNNMGVGRL